MVDDIAEAFGHWVKDTLLRILEPVFCFITRSILFVATLGFVRIPHSSCKRNWVLALIGFIVVFSLTLYIFYLVNN